MSTIILAAKTENLDRAAALYHVAILYQYHISDITHV